VALIDFLKPTMVGKNKKRGPPKEGGSPKRGPPKERVSPIQVVPPPPRRRESPRRSGSSVQEHSDDRFILPTSPQAGNEVDTGNIQVSPNEQSLDSLVNNEPAVNEEEKLHSSTANNEPPVNDQSLDSEANNDVASDSVVPELLADHDENCKCDWSHIVACTFPQLKPLKCTVDGCNKLVHHLCQIAFEQREGFPETLPLKCCLHHPQSPFRASKPPPVNDLEDKLHSSTATTVWTRG
jgi:hypothetical protein